MKTKVLTLACAALAMIQGLSSCSKQQTQGGQMVPDVAVMTITPGTAQYESSYPVTIKGKTDIDIRPQVSGFITKVCVDEGQRVHKGQTLFIIDQVQYQAAVDQALANVNSAKTAVSTARITEENKRMLLNKNIISETEWQMAANQLAQAEAALAQANAALVSARKNLAYTTVTAPSDGYVGKIPNREGSLASPSSAQPLTTVSDNSEVYAYFAFTEKELLDLTNGGTTSIEEGIKQLPDVELELSAGTRYPLKGRVATVSGVIDNTTGAASSRALFPNPSGMLRSGNTGQLILPHTAENAIVIPQKATYELQNLRYVYTLNDSNVAVPAPITVMPYSDGKTFVVTTGLKEGDRIVTEGVGTTVRPGTQVRPKAQAEAQAAPEAGAQAAQ